MSGGRALSSQSDRRPCANLGLGPCLVVIRRVTESEKLVLRRTVRNTCDVDVFQTQRVVLGTSKTFVRGTRRYGPLGKLQTRRPMNLISHECDEVFRVMGLPRRKRVRVRSIARAMGQFLEEDGTVSQNCRPTQLNHSHGRQ